jgi:acetyl esterase/lipase
MRFRLGSLRTVSPGLRVASLLALALVALVPVAAIAQTGPPATPRFTTWEYLPGVEADLYLPARSRSHQVPVIVMVPGGGWQTADRSGLGQLAEAFVAKGIAVSNTTYRVGTPTSIFPVPPQDVRCAVDASVAKVKRAGLRPGPIVVLGHSAGAHLSSLAVFGASAFDSRACRYPDARVDGWVGLSGIYDLRVVGQYSWTMMGGTAEELPDLYAQAATETHLGDGGRNHVDVLVVHGDADELIPPVVAEQFSALLRERGYDTQLTIVPGADHAAVYQAPVVADTVLTWLRQVEGHRAGR